MPVLVPVDLTLSRSFRKPICSGTLMEGTSLSYVLNSSKVFVGCGLMGGRSDEFKVQPQKKFGKKNNCRESVTTQDNRVLRPRSLARSLATPKIKTHPQNTSPQNTKNRITKGISDFGNKAAFARRQGSAR